MKKTISLILFLLLTLSVFVACGGVSLSGRYALVGMADNGEDQIPRLEAARVNPDEIYIEFNDSGTFEVALMTFDGVEKAEGTYKIDGNTMTLSFDNGSSIKATIDSDTITIKQGSSRMVFEKEGGAS